MVATIGESIQLLYVGRLEYFIACGFDVTVICGSSAHDEAIRARGVRLKTVEFARSIVPWTDCRVIWQLYRYFRREDFDLVEVGTPKAALIGSIAARAAKVPCLIHLLHGASYEGKRGWLGRLLRLATWVPCHLGTHTVAVSPSVAARVCADGIAAPSRIAVLGSGSANGVDLARFAPDRELGRATRAALAIPDRAVVIGFVGRLTGDKGINELVEAFAAVHHRHPETRLLAVGPIEERDVPSPSTRQVLRSHPAIRHVGMQMDVRPYMAAMDIVALPTHREGLGNVLLEAAAFALPTVTTAVTGARDAIVPGVTGFQVPAGDATALAAALNRLIGDNDLRRTMGSAGREWVGRRFDQATVWQHQVQAYRMWARPTREGHHGTD